MMSSHGEPKSEVFSFKHCWFVEPITRPILQASQQSFGKEEEWKQFNYLIAYRVEIGEMLGSSMVWKNEGGKVKETF